MFRSGVFQSTKCKDCRSADGSANWKGCSVNHVVTLVGYGEENGVKFWKIKNSWGTDWGEGGFGKILRGTSHCGIAMDFSVPICTLSDTAPAPSGGGGSCGGTLAGASGTIMSLGFPEGYDNYQDCTWTISPAEGNKVTIDNRQ